MSRFEYLSVLLSIVIALGISEMVSSWGALLRQRRLVRFYWVHRLWTAALVLTPRAVPGDAIDLRSHFYEQTPVLRGIGLVATAWGALSTNERTHQTLALGCMALLAAFVTVAVTR